MENKIHDDRLDDYVRKSFEDYEETPAPDMWERVEGDLPPGAPAEETPAPSLSLRRYRWQAAAAAVILLLLSGLVCEHFYYEQKIRDLTAQNGDLQELAGEKPATGGDVFVEKNSRQNTPQQADDTSFEKISGQTKAATPNGENSQTPRSKQGAIQSHPVTGNAQSTNDSPVVQTPETAISKNQSVPENTKTQPTVPDQKPGVEQLATENLIADETTTAFAELTDFEQLAAPVLPVKIENPTYPVLSLLPIKPKKEPSGWYVGLHATPHFILDNAPNPVRRPGGRPVFVSRQEKPEVSADWWLKIGKKISPRLSLEGGVGFRKISRTATHTARFRFADGIMGGSPQRRNFRYDLSTYGGSAAVSLRMEQVDSAPVQDDEPIALRISTSERTHLLRIPLLAAYRMGTGRLHGILKAGLTGNIFLKNELDIATRVSQNNRFQPAQGSDSYTLQLENRGKFFLGYWLSAGVEYKLAHRISLVAEPSFSGEFPRNDAAGRQLPGHFSVGLNIGANYYF